MYFVIHGAKIINFSGMIQYDSILDDEYSIFLILYEPIISESDSIKRKPFTGLPPLNPTSIYGIFRLTVFSFLWLQNELKYRSLNNVVFLTTPPGFLQTSILLRVLYQRRKK